MVVVALSGCDLVFGLDVPAPAPDAPPPPDHWDVVAGGRAHTCGIRIDHTLWCWGRNDVGQLGARASAADLEDSVPRQVGTDTTWISVDTRDDTTCALKDDHTLWCWGRNTSGQVALPPGSDGMVAEPRQVDGTWTAVAVGADHACALDEDGRAHCWGRGIDGQLGDGSMTDRPAPGRVTSSATFVSLTAGDQFTCGLEAGGAASCWGANNVGQLGDATLTYRDVPTPVQQGGLAFDRLAAGARFACGVTTDRRLRCWGAGTRGQLGDGSGADASAPVVVDQDQHTDWVDVGAGAQHACARRDNGEVWCWGSSEVGQLASETTTAFRSTPAQAATSAPIVGLGLGARHTCVIDDARVLSCAGFAAHGALGIAGEGSQRAPVNVAGPGGWASASAGSSLTCAIRGGELHCWGANDRGAVGDGTQRDRAAPVREATANTWRSVSVREHACAIDTTSSLLCWGANGRGQVGDGSTTDRLTPLALTGFDTSLGVGTFAHTCAVRSNNEMWCWGRNEDGQVGESPGADVTTPVKPSTGQWGGARWVAVSAGSSHTCGITSVAPRNVRCWGNNSSGQLGNAGGSTFEPVDVALPMTGADELTTGEHHTCARIGAGAWCWGANADGQLGDQTTNQTSIPRALAGSWLAIDAGDAHTCGVRTDNTLWCWGRNGDGQLGDGTMFRRTEPTQVGTGADWVGVTAGRSHTCGVTVGGELRCWGSNLRGELGTGTAWRSMLVAITQ